MAPAPDGIITLSKGWRVGKPVNLGPIVNSVYREAYTAPENGLSM